MTLFQLKNQVRLTFHIGEESWKLFGGRGRPFDPTPVFVSVMMDFQRSIIINGGYVSEHNCNNHTHINMLQVLLSASHRHLLSIALIIMKMFEL